MPRKGRSSSSDDYNISVFINCPFDTAYKKLFNSVVFAVIHCGFKARCALEIDDGGQVRIDKILKIVEGCKYGVHDLSRTELDRVSRLPRFNMPLELGLFLGASRFGAALQRRKRSLILDRHPHRYQKFISDISGQDIKAHAREERQAIRVVRDWLSTSSGRAIPGGAYLYQRYLDFRAELPRLCRDLKLKKSELTYNDFSNIVAAWIAQQAAA
jgi:hypothetical protein